MKVLVGCEYSAQVRNALNSIHGVYAYSCDLLPTEDGQTDYHYQGDIFDILYRYKWDALIAFPPCTFITNSGVSWLYKNGRKENGIDPIRWENMKQGAEFFKALLDAPIKMKAIENPIPHKYALEIIGRKYDQIIQGWMFGHPEQKATCLWLDGFEPLVETNNVREEMKNLPKKLTQRVHYMSPSKNRGLERSRTLWGVAQAMAEQWFR